MVKIVNRRSILLFVMLFVLLIQFTGAFIPQDAYATERTVILFDEVHLQYYNSERMPSAIASLNGTEDYIVFINHQRFTQTMLLGVDILVIGNPERSFTNQELLAISEYLKNGGNLFLLGDPRGKASNLNDIIDTAQYTDARFSENVILDEEHNLNNISTQISVSREELRESSPIANGVQELVTHSIWVEDSDPTNVIATGSNYSLAGLEGSSQPAWLVASIVGRSRIVLCGSTRMFSDTKPAKSDVTWYQLKDNALLWQNIFSWLDQKDTPPSFLGTIIPPPLTVIVSALILGVVFIGGGLGIYYLFQRKELKPISETLRKKKIEEPKPMPEGEVIPPPKREEEVPTEKELPPPTKKEIKKKGKKRKYRIRR